MQTFVVLTGQQTGTGDLHVAGQKHQADCRTRPPARLVLDYTGTEAGPKLGQLI